MPTFLRSAGSAALAAGLAIIALTAPVQAAPPPPFTLGYHAAATTTVKKLGQQVDFPSTTSAPPSPCAKLRRAPWTGHSRCRPRTRRSASDR